MGPPGRGGGELTHFQTITSERKIIGHIQSQEKTIFERERTANVVREHEIRKLYAEETSSRVPCPSSEGGGEANGGDVTREGRDGSTKKATDF